MGYLEGILSTVLYSGIGIALFIGGYYLVALLVNRKYNLHEEIDNHNVAAGTAVAGIFVAIAIVISGVIQ